MTENEYKHLRNLVFSEKPYDHKEEQAIIKIFEEIQQYRAIGLTPKMVKEMIESEKLASHQAIIRGAKLELYEAIGTIEECRSAVERMKPKKILYRIQPYGTPWLCPECEADQIKCEFFSEDGSEPQEKHTFCWKCGTVIDWSE